jgi:hypothetical protein
VEILKCLVVVLAGTPAAIAAPFCARLHATCLALLRKEAHVPPKTHAVDLISLTMTWPREILRDPSLGIEPVHLAQILLKARGDQKQTAGLSGDILGCLGDIYGVFPEELEGSGVVTLGGLLREGHRQLKTQVDLPPEKKISNPVVAGALQALAAALARCKVRMVVSRPDVHHEPLQQARESHVLATIRR